MTTIRITDDALRSWFGITRPRLAVLGLNPHASDNGLMGTEEEEIIRPVIIEAKKSGELVMGPYPADGFFGATMYRKVDAVLAMYQFLNDINSLQRAIGEFVYRADEISQAPWIEELRLLIL